MTALPGKQAHSPLPLRVSFAFAFSAWAVLASCVSPPRIANEDPLRRNGELYSPMQEVLTEKARSLIGRRDRIAVGDVRFNADCSGTMLAIFFAAGLDLRPGFTRSPGSSGVEKLYRLMEDSGLLDDTDLPLPGSLVFWDDTYDRNGDGKKNDPFTHVGIVVSAEPNGDLHYVHYHYREGVIEEHMNLNRPSIHIEKSGEVDVVVNSPLRMKGWKPDAESLSGQLYRVGARSYEYAGTKLALGF